MQIRGIEDVSAVSVLGTVGMLVALTIAAIKICVTPRVESYRHGPGFRHFFMLNTLFVSSMQAKLLPAISRCPHLMDTSHFGASISGWKPLPAISKCTFLSGDELLLHS